MFQKARAYVKSQDGQTKWFVRKPIVLFGKGSTDIKN